MGHTETIKADRTFWCMHCDFKCPAIIKGTGIFVGNYSKDETEIVKWKTKKAAEDHARSIFGLIECPQCGATDSAAMNRFTLGVVVRVVFIGLLLCGVGYYIAAAIAGITSADLVWRVLGAFVGFGVGAALAGLWRALVLRVLRRRVTLFPDQAPSTDLTRL